MNADSLSAVLTPFSGGIRLTVRAKPGLSRARDIKIVDIGDGKHALEVSVADSAREGKANKALIKRISEELDIPKAHIVLKSGETGRIKIIEITGDPHDLTRKISELLFGK